MKIIPKKIQIEEEPNGRKYWRSLDQLADKPEFKKILEREFPEFASEMLDPISRRKFLFLMGASLSLAGLTACRRPVHKILPFAKLNEETVPGVPIYYASVMSLGAEATGLLVRSNEGRPTKVEGNPGHPSSLGATNAFVQASILELYDPDRSQSVLQGETKKSWQDYTNFASSHFASLRDKKGAGLRVLSGRVNSASLADTRSQFVQVFPEAKWVEYEPINDDNMLAGSAAAFGQPLRPHYAFDKADVVLSIDSDFLCMEGQATSNLKHYSKRRRVTEHKAELNRLYVVESQFSVTGAAADHRLRLKTSEIKNYLFALASEILRTPELASQDIQPITNQLFKSANAQPYGKWIAAVAKDLIKNKGKSVIVAGSRQPASVHAVVHLLNKVLGNEGETVKYTRSFSEQFSPMLDALKELTKEIEQGSVDTLLILGGNPAFDAPADLDFGRKLKDKVPVSVRLGLYEDETSAVSKWHINEAHYLESWSDAVAYDGTTAIQQPLVEPLYEGKTAAEVVALALGSPENRAYEIVRNYWVKQFGADKPKAWEKSLNDGLVAESQYPPVTPNLQAESLVAALEKASSQAKTGDVEVTFVVCPSVYDGRFANNGWLQETPHPMTKLTWGNAALISPATAKAKGIDNGDMLKLTLAGRELEIPAMIQPGHSNDSLTVALGHGRSKSGRIARGTGHNSYLIRTTEGFDFAAVTVAKTGEKYPLATTQEHHSLEGRPIFRETTVEEYGKNPEVIKEMAEVPKDAESIYDTPAYEGQNQWAMAIDLNSCVGCNACVVACQSENNIPIVGKEQVMRGREMHWIRLDRYYTGDENEPEAVQQPVACQQCELAPCEPVCPVAATAHSPEGLNDMAYNRCIGTRYCANNCPFKVRRFNFLNFHKDLTEVGKLAFNPEVTVRHRGVMEKCTYCVQRVQSAKIKAKSEGHRDIKDGEVVTACQQVCPADAIIFGDLKDPNSKVAQLKKQERNYEMLAELNIKPRTSYLARLRNPNPELA